MERAQEKADPARKRCRSMQTCCTTCNDRTRRGCRKGAGPWSKANRSASSHAD
nr:MAG TPA: conotoxin [Caudoviricetes sp.]